LRGRRSHPLLQAADKPNCPSIPAKFSPLGIFFAVGSTNSARIRAHSALANSIWRCDSFCSAYVFVDRVAINDNSGPREVLPSPSKIVGSLLPQDALLDWSVRAGQTGAPCPNLREYRTLTFCLNRGAGQINVARGALNQPRVFPRDSQSRVRKFTRYNRKPLF